jgi:hypothetical protein
VFQHKKETKKSPTKLVTMAQTGAARNQNNQKSEQSTPLAQILHAVISVSDNQP